MTSSRLASRAAASSAACCRTWSRSTSTARATRRRSSTSSTASAEGQTERLAEAVVDLQARDVDAELGDHVLRLEAELLEQARMALGVDLIGQLLLGLLDL